VITTDDQDRLDDYSDAMADLCGQPHRLENDPAGWLQDFAALLAEGNELLDRLRARLMPGHDDPPGGDAPW
jgi:hypothetical protein